MNATVIVLSYNGARYLPACLDSLAGLPAQFQVLVVDNGSADESAALARAAAGRVAVVENGENLGFSGGMNRGMRLALGLETLPGLALTPADVVVLLNQDTRCLAGWPEAILAPFDDPAVGAVGCKIYADDERTILHVGAGLDAPRATTYHIGQGERDQGQYPDVMPVQYATGAALALRASALREVGLFDERFSPAYMEEVDLCARLWRAGYRVVVNPAAALIHYEGTSTPDPLLRAYWFNRGRLLYLVKHCEIAELAGAFAAAERAFLGSVASPGLLRAIKRAYLDALLRMPDWLAARAACQETPVSAGEREQVLQIFASLRDACVRGDAALSARSIAS